jgi:plastocyanin
MRSFLGCVVILVLVQSAAAAIDIEPSAPSAADLPAMLNITDGINTPAITTFEVDIINFAFSPSTITIQAGDTIHWVWKANMFSTTSVAGSAEFWTSGVHNSGFTYDHTFTKTGTFAYYDQIHGFDNGDGTAGGAAGTITVTAAPEPGGLALAAIAYAGLLGRTRPRKRIA